MTSSGITPRDLELASLVEGFEEARLSNPELGVDDWAEKYPDFAEDLRGVLPSLMVLAQAASAADHSAGVRVTSEPVPDHIGEYRILTLLGRGGMGVVYLAIHEPLQREVALKVLPADRELGEEFLERFRREARVAAALDHPNIVPVYDVGQSDGRHFFAMRFVDGCSLEEVLREMRYGEKRDRAMGGGTAARAAESGAPGSSSVAQTPSRTTPSDSRGSGDMASAVRAIRDLREDLRLGAERREPAVALSTMIAPRAAARTVLALASAVAHAHDAGVLHRDIKPGNVLLDRDGRPFVTDFGLCRVDEGLDLTRTQSVVGTLRYMAPEQVEGAAEERSDVYALGLVLFEMLTLNPAFDASRRARLLHDILHQSVPRIRRYRRGVPRPLEVIVQKATAKIAEERYGSARAMARDLDAFLQDRPIAARPPSALYLARLFFGRHRFGSIVSLVALLLLGGLGVRYVSDLRVSRAAALQSAYAADLAAAEAALREGAAERARTRLAGAPEDLRSWEWRHLMALADQSLESRSLDMAWLDSASVSPDGRFAAVVGKGGLAILRLPSLDVTCRIDDGAVRGVAWHPDGDRLALSFEWDALVLYSVDGDGNATVLASDHSLEAAITNSARLAFVGEDVVFGAGNGLVRRWNPGAGTVVREASLQGRVVGCGALRAGASQGPGTAPAVGWWAVTDLGLLAVERDDEIAWFDLELTGEPVTAAVCVGGDVVVVTDQGGILRVPVDGAGRLERYRSTGSHLASVAANGDTIIASGVDKRVHIVDRWNPSRTASLSGSAHVIGGLDWLPDGRGFLSVSTESVVRMWNLDAVGGGQRLVGHVNDVSRAMFDRSGRRMATGGRSGLVFVWDALRAEPLARFEDAEEIVTGLGFDEREGGDRLLAVTSHGEGLVWSLSEGTLLRRGRIGIQRAYNAVWDPVRGALAVASDRGVQHMTSDAELLDAGGYEEAPDEPPTTGIAFDPDTRELVSVRIDGRVRILGPGGAQREYQLDLMPEPRVYGVMLGLRGTPSEGLMLHSVQGQRIVVVRIRDGEVLAHLGDPLSAESRGELLMGATFTPDGERILATTRHGLVGVWTLEGEHLLDLRAHDDWGLSMITSPATGLAVSISSDNTVRIWSDRSSTETAALRASVSPLASPDHIAEVRRAASLEETLARIERALTQPGRGLVRNQRNQLRSIRRWHPGNRRAAAMVLLDELRAAPSFEKASRIEQAIASLAPEDSLTVHLRGMQVALQLRAWAQRLRK